MAKKSTLVSEKGLTREDINRVWSQLGETQWLAVVKAFKPGHAFAPAGGGSLKGRCVNPEHEDHSPSFFIHPQKGFARCFGCGYTTQNPITLLGHIMDVPAAEVFQYLITKHQIRVLNKRALAEFESQQLNLAAKDAIYNACRTALANAIAVPNDPKNAFALKAVNWLIHERSVPESILHTLPVGVMPPLARLTEIINDQYATLYRVWQADPEKFPEPRNFAIPAAEYLHNTSQWQHFSGSVVFPLNATPGEISRLKLRAPQKDKDFKIPDDPYESMLGIYGLGWEQYHDFYKTPKGRPDYAYLTEGEMDVLTVMSRFMVNGKVSFPLYSIGGTGGAPHFEALLTTMGVTRAYFIGDSPGPKRGEVVLQQWLDRTYRLDARVFVGWDKLAPSMDIDEYVVQNSVSKLTTEIITNALDNFVPAWSWAIDQATSEIQQLPSHDAKDAIVIAAAHGRYLRNRLDCELYAQEIAQRYAFNADILKREIAAREDTEEGFILRCKDALSDLLYFAGTEAGSQGTGRIAVLFDKKRKRYHRFRLNNAQAIFQELAPVIGPPCDFVRNFVGYPGFLPDPASDLSTAGTQLTGKIIQEHMNTAVMKWSTGSPDYSTAVVYNQGYHYIEDDNGGIAREYVVCGADVYRITRDESGMHATMLDGPSDEGYVFNVSKNSYAPESWVPGGLTAKLLEDADKLDPKALYNDLVTFFDVGFCYKHQNVVPQLLASFALLFPIMDAFERPPLLFVTGQSSSGKSTLLSAFAHSTYTGSTGIRVMYGSLKYDNYSSASVAYEAANSTLLRILDEFEITHSDKNHANAVRATYEQYRSMVNGASTRMRVNSDSGVSRVVLRHPIIFGAISPTDTIADLNRLTLVEMRKQDGAFSSQTRIYDRIGEDRVRQLGHQTYRALLPHIPALRALYPGIKRRYAEVESSMPISVPERYVSAFYNTFTLMEFLGVDWVTFFRNWVTANQDLIKRAASTNESEAILRDMMNASVIKVADRDNPMCVAQLLANPDTRDLVNSASVGVYYDSGMRLLLINVVQAVQRLLNRPGQMPITAIRLKDILDRHATTLTTSEVLKCGIIGKSLRHLGSGAQTHDVVVIKADPWLGTPQAQPVVVPPPVQAPVPSTPQVATVIAAVNAPDVIEVPPPTTVAEIIDAPRINPDTFNYDADE